MFDTTPEMACLAGLSLLALELTTGRLLLTQVLILLVKTLLLLTGANARRCCATESWEWFNATTGMMVSDRCCCVTSETKQATTYTLIVDLLVDRDCPTTGACTSFATQKREGP